MPQAPVSAVPTRFTLTSTPQLISAQANTKTEVVISGHSAIAFYLGNTSANAATTTGHKVADVNAAAGATATWTTSGDVWASSDSSLVVSVTVFSR